MAVTTIDLIRLRMIYFQRRRPSDLEKKDEVPVVGVKVSTLNEFEEKTRVNCNKASTRRENCKLGDIDVL